MAIKAYAAAVIICILKKAAAAHCTQEGKLLHNRWYPRCPPLLLQDGSIFSSCQMRDLTDSIASRSPFWKYFLRLPIPGKETIQGHSLQNFLDHPQTEMLNQTGKENMGKLDLSSVPMGKMISAFLTCLGGLQCRWIDLGNSLKGLFPTKLLPYFPCQAKQSGESDHKQGSIAPFGNLCHKTGFHYTVGPRCLFNIV